MVLWALFVCATPHIRDMLYVIADSDIQVSEHLPSKCL
jgi:hypothetical protein